MLWGANAVSNLSDGLAFVSIPLLAASLTDDPRWVAGLATLYAIVRLLVALPVGVYVDRLDRRTLMVAANVLRGVTLLSLAFVLQFGMSSLVVLYAAMAIVGTLESIADNAAVAMLPSVVRRDRLDRANGRITAAQLVADEFIGPPLGGMLFAIAATAPVFAMGGLWAAAGVLALALPRSPARPTNDGSAADEPTHDRAPSADPSPAARSVYREAREGIAWLARHRVVGSLALIGALASVAYMLPFSILVLFAGQRLGLDAAGYGLLLAFSALGGLVGTVLAPRMRERLGYRWTIVASLLLGASTLVGLAFTSHPFAAGILLALYILHAVVWSICAVSLRQRLVPHHLLGRVGGAARVLSLLGLAAGSAAGGILATIDIALPVGVGGCLFLACALLAVVSLRGTLHPDDDLPTTPATAP